jgi:hypothetical protein
MKYYATKDGYLTYWGNTADDSLPEFEGCEVFAGDPPTDLQFSPKPEPKYFEQRFKEYPYLGDQMDMFWHAMNDGVIPKIEPFFTQIKTVKEKYPKP